MFVLASLLCACSSSGNRQGGFVNNLAKSDIGMVAEVHYQSVKELLQELTLKLYQRNPVQLKKARGKSVEDRLHQLFSSPKQMEFAELNGIQGINAMQLAFDPQFKGDRVYALMAGLTGMINKSYGFRSEFYMLGDPLDEAALYKSARNTEVLVWMLGTRYNLKGRPLILTNSLPGEESVNLSFERLFGKLIAKQDTIAAIAAQKNDRFIKTIVHNVASMAFIPF